MASTCQGTGVAINSYPLYQKQQKCFRPTPPSGVARALLGGRASHSKNQNEEENEEKVRKNKRNYGKMRKDQGTVLILPTRE